MIRRMAMLAATFSAAACSAAPSTVVTGMPERLTLPVPTMAGGTDCATLASGAETTPVQLRRTFAEPFDKLDMRRWTPHFDGGYDWPVKRYLEGNGEQQIYVDKGYRGTAPNPLGLDPFSIRDGVLTITGSAVPAKALPYLYGRRYMSGLLTTRTSLVQTYGYFEMRGRIPAGQGLWPAFWLIPADKSWPPEIDVMEARGREPAMIPMSVHWKENGVGPHKGTGCKPRVEDSTTAFHLYGALWQADRITFYIDRKPVGTLARPPGVDRPMYMLVNLAMGGRYGGNIDATTPLPARMDVDHIAAYAIVPPPGGKR